MDPNAALTKVRTCAREIMSGGTMRSGQPDGLSKDDALSIAGELAEQFEALDEWLGKGGFPPDDWALHISEVQWRISCRDCGYEVTGEEDDIRRKFEAYDDSRTRNSALSPHRVRLESRVHAFSEWKTVDT
jgi:hypothetical protein